MEEKNETPTVEETKESWIRRNGKYVIAYGSVLGGVLLGMAAVSQLDKKKWNRNGYAFGVGYHAAMEDLRSTMKEIASIES